MLTAPEIATLCVAGGMAPSGGNEQPWRVSIGASQLLVTRDEDRSDNSFLDVGGYAAYFAIGCFTENVALAAQALGLRYRWEISDGGVEFTFISRHARPTVERFACVRERVTNRRPFDGTSLSEAEIATLSSTVEPPNELSVVSTADRKQDIARALGAADVLRMRNQAMFDDMVREIRWTEQETKERPDGLDVKTLELPGATVKLLSLLRRLPRLRTALPAGKLADTARQVVANSSHMCCLSTSDSITPDAMVAAGQAMQRLWLEATLGGISVHPWTVSTLLLLRLEVFAGVGFTERERDEVARFGRDLRQGFGLAPGVHPLLVFRLFRAPSPAARSLRLPWQSFTTIEERVNGDD